MAGGRILSQLAAGHTAAESDVKTLEAKNCERLEVTAKQVVAAAGTFQKAMEEIAGTANLPLLNPAMGFEATREPAQDSNAPPRACGAVCQESAPR